LKNDLSLKSGGMGSSSCRNKNVSSIKDFAAALLQTARATVAYNTNEERTKKPHKHFHICGILL